MTGEWRGRCVLVTGGTRGVGRAIADRLLAEGASVAVCARSAADLAAMEADAPPDRFLGVAADVATAEGVARFHEAARHRFGGTALAGLVSNAGSAVVGSFLDTTDQDWRYHIEARLLAAIRLGRLVARDMAAAGGGSIVHIAGAAGADPTAFLAVAGVVNAGLLNLTRMMADELADRRIRVNAVNPGTLDTRLGGEVVELYAAELGLDPELLRDEMRSSVPLGRIPQPGDVAEAALFFLSDRSSMITGSTLTPDGGTLVRRARG